MYSADSDLCDVRRLSAVVPILLVADSHNIVPLLCSALYQRYVWGIHQPVVGLCCFSTVTISMAIFGWLNSDQSEEGRMISRVPYPQKQSILWLHCTGYPIYPTLKLSLGYNWTNGWHPGPTR
ncbi:hypothetical protein BD769DRAFT_1495588 [Suillus cothurnatus]|nr:hypothetical protein BD769DRAFT_1495588 [Suillus cothurnatus]